MVVPPAAGGAVLACAVLLWIGSLFYPAARPVSLYYGRPLKGSVIVLDPGHGGIDSGSHYEGRILEKDIVLAVGLELRRLLSQAGATVIMTRERDEDTSKYIPGDPASRYQRDMHGRLKVINESGADLFISLHLNSFSDPTVRGAIAFYNPGRPDNKILAETIQKQVNPLMASDPKPGQTVHSSPKEGSYFLTNEANIPGIILEMGFMTSPIDREIFTQPRNQGKLSQAIFLGIVEYIYTYA